MALDSSSHYKDPCWVSFPALLFMLTLFFFCQVLHLLIFFRAGGNNPIFTTTYSESKYFRNRWMDLHSSRYLTSPGTFQSFLSSPTFINSIFSLSGLSLWCYHKVWFGFISRTQFVSSFSLRAARGGQIRIYDRGSGLLIKTTIFIHISGETRLGQVLLNPTHRFLWPLMSSVR